MERKIQALLKRFEEVETLLSDPEVLGDKEKYTELSREHSYLLELKEAFLEYDKASLDLKNNLELAKAEKDPEFLEIIKDEIDELKEAVPALKSKVEALLVPPDPNDDNNSIIEIRAGTGGDEAAIFVGDCVRMYKLFADKMGWSVEHLSSASSEAGGFKEYIMVLSGKNVYRNMKFEGGTHRVQRVPVTETQGRVHTSAITVAVMLEPKDDAPIDIDEKDLKIDTYRASGAGGQHVNTTDSAVRITHMPTGTVAYCSEERSQHKNKDKAMRLLSARIAEEKRIRLQKERDSQRSSQVGSGDRSERIRTYNFSQNRLTDHRIDLTLYKLDQIMEGDLGDVCEALVKFFYQQKLSES